jgi:hypothetical protein
MNRAADAWGVLASCLAAIMTRGALHTRAAWRGCPAGVGSVLLPPPARGHGRKEHEKPRIAELKKANAGPKGRTLAHKRATSRRSR